MAFSNEKMQTPVKGGPWVTAAGAGGVAAAGAGACARTLEPALRAMAAAQRPAAIGLEVMIFLEPC